jgi:restriction system protein
MPRYWIIAPVSAESPDLFDKVWQFDLANNFISIGWARLGDVSKMSRQELFEAVASTYPERAQGLVTNMIWAFYHEIGPGDFVIARRGLKILVAVGKVTQSAVYSPGKIPHIDHANILGVSWQEFPRDKAFPSIVFRRQTVIEISDENFHKLVEGATPPPQPSEEIEDPQAFVLEKYLEDFIVGNFHAIFKGDLRIYEDSEGNGQQYETDVGPIDILAVEPKSKSFVVIELKKGRPSDQVVGQVLRYMGWVKRNLCNDGQAVKGLVICRDPDPRLSYALEMTKDIDVRYYTVSFKLAELRNQ